MAVAIPATNRWALLIGIDHYQNFPFQNLKGCVNDIVLVADILRERFGFPAEHIATVTNERATRQGILDSLRALTERVGMNDEVVMFYAGHGSRMRDREGNKPTGMDETLVPHDSGRGCNPNRDITDDELRVWLANLSQKTPNITLIFDSCHSGTMTRDGFGESTRSLPADDRDLSLLPPTPIARSQPSLLDVPAPSVCMLPPSDRYVVLAACRETEKARERIISNGDEMVHHGAFTTFLVEALLRPGAPPVTYRDLHEHVGAAMLAEIPNQHPCAEGLLDRKLFGIDVETIAPYLTVSRIDKDKLWLAGGEVHGVRIDSEWELYPSGSMGPGGSTVALGRCRVTATGASIAQARILSQGESMRLPLRAFLVHQPESDAGWSVEISGIEDAAYLTALQQRLFTSPWLCPAQASVPAAVRLYLVQPRTVVTDAVPVPQLGVVSVPSWAAVSRDGQLLFSAVEQKSPLTDAMVLREKLDRLCRYQQVRSLHSTNSQMNTCLDFSLLRATPNGDWKSVPRDSWQRSVCKDGDRISMQLLNHSRLPVYIAVLVLGIDHCIELVYPPPGGKSQELQPGAPCIIGAWALEFPSGPLEPPGVTLNEGIDVIQVLITTSAVDYSVLLQEGVRGADTVWSKHPLGRKLGRALRGYGARTGSPDGGSDATSVWGIMSHEILLKKGS